ncbi:hypothetical protein QBC33DRAFT_545162 [Phialemonium atrogriseum]|uniref:Uncharacterized protein n=1 Tax=Phialemonium atrogriseum TaxID=1093897 RepID=A0AAJ0BYE7_9PEZI|nr:uncharacterized protein QBC33DRAFT_545162 [Phialemonium atrogriseum]KAK1765337.1 hypothetical protein QBC33DRAFT_545162 [Phialemonium atrogriseum]
MSSQDAMEGIPNFDNSGNRELIVPGFSGIEIDHDLLPDCRFTHGVNEWHGERLTVRELQMLRLMDSITDKPEWDRKIFDEEIVGKWRAEATLIPLISEKAWEWCVTELRDKARIFKETGKVITYDTGSRCVKSDVIVGPELQAELLSNVEPLLQVPDHQKDWHPGSNDQVLNLVHPSLYPLVYGKTEVLQNGGRVDLSNIFASCGQGTVARTHNRPTSDTWSWRFQWLPCEVEFAADTGTDMRITSYINNLHPDKHKPLYGTIEKLIGLSIPLWNDVLAKEGGGRSPVRIKTFGAGFDVEMPDWAEWGCRPNSSTDEGYPEFMAKVKDWLSRPENPDFVAHSDDEEDEEEDEEGGGAAEEGEADGWFERLDARVKRLSEDPNSATWDVPAALGNAIERKWKRIRSVVHPEPGESFTYEQWKEGVQTPVVPPADWSGGRNREVDNFSFQDVRLEDTFREQGLQVIVKLASIELTPEKPTYDGGSWHLEGMLNEHIVATAIYYYDVDNVTDSQLFLRQEAVLDEVELVYEQGQHDHLCAVFGVPNLQDEPAVQELGHVATRHGRLLVFPNTLQHSVGGFELRDAARPGHRRFVVLWLVDPHYRVCSTANVPPQRHDWWAERGLDTVRLGPLPQEVVDMVRRNVGEWPMGREEAEELRRELMRERTHMTEAVEERFEQYNLCEH